MIDGYSGIVVTFYTMPKNNEITIYEECLSELVCAVQLTVVHEEPHTTDNIAHALGLVVSGLIEIRCK